MHSIKDKRYKLRIEEKGMKTSFGMLCAVHIK